MDTIIQYLQNPMKVGVWNEKWIVDFSGLPDYLKGLAEKSKEKHEKRKKRQKKSSIPSFNEWVFEARLGEVTKALAHLDRDSKFPLRNIDEILSTFAKLSNFPQAVADLFSEEIEVVDVDGKKRKAIRWKHELPPIFDSHIVAGTKDVFSIEKKPVKRDEWFFDIVTIKEGSDTGFKRCVEGIPPLKKGMKILKKKRQFSTRYTFRPYPLATQLWLDDRASISIPSDLRSFLQGAIRYFLQGEWRTSIVLSAISVESMLADLYEEKFKKPAPDVALGELFREVKEKITFPQEIISPIEMTNKARIAAVHRSPFPVSDREAINALYGATKFTLWYSSEF